MNKEEKTRFENNWVWANAYWKRKTEQIGIQGWNFEINHMKRALAITNYTKKKVCISSYLLREKSCDEQKIRNTILHEIAHIIAGHSNAHNKKWKDIALKIGCDGEICGKMSHIPGNYLMYCPKGCFKKEYYRRPKIENKLCKKCNSSPKIKTI